MLLRENFVLSAAILSLWMCCSASIAAEKSPPAEFPVNPLEITTPDPLLPKRALQKQPLTPVERLKLISALEQLNQQAAAKLQADPAAAFAIWNRELRLRRVLGFPQEVAALGRVGAIAWRENDRLEVQIITQRLQTIKQELLAQKQVNLPVLQSLGTAFEQVREPKAAIDVYNQILTVVRQQKDQAAEVATLKTIGDLHVSWFDYPQAATSYQELLRLATANNDPISQVSYLQQLAYIYQQARQYKQAIATREQLAELYLKQAEITQIPRLRLAIAADYEALSQIQPAFRNYQEAYASAWSLQQYYRAGDALRQLIRLYRAQGQIDAALETSQILLQADQFAANVYGLVNTYDQIGQMHLQRQNYSLALIAFQEGLKLAQQLQYQETYFAQRIDQVNQQMSK